MKILLGAGAAVLILFMVVLFGGISWRDTGVSLEETTIAQVKYNKSLYDKFWKSVSEVAQVPAQYKKDFGEVYQGIMESRYPKGQNPLFKWIKEDNPKFDSSLYAKIQEVIVAGRNEFNRGQQDLSDKQRALKQHVRKSTGWFYGKFFDIPSVQTGSMAPAKDIDGDGKITVLDYPIVTSTKTEQVFAEGKDDEPIRVFNSAPTGFRP